MSLRVIVTSRPAAADVAFDEIRRVDPKAKRVKKLTIGEQLVETAFEWAELWPILRDDAVFIRHIFPVSAVWRGVDLDAAAALLGQGRAVSVQCRNMSGVDGGDDIRDRLRVMGFVAGDSNAADGESVLSVYGHGGDVYWGVSCAAENLSKRNGGVPRFGREVGEISRAGFKLTEAAEVFGFDFPKEGRALDLGAAPGGFTSVILDAGMYVTAVDPAELDERVRGRERLTRFAGLAQYYAADETFDVITNDMRIDIYESVAIMNSMGKFLDNGLDSQGVAVMTLKLSDGNWGRKTSAAVGKLKEAFGFVKARQLFNNRSEVTVLLRSYLATIS